MKPPFEMICCSLSGHLMQCATFNAKKRVDAHHDLRQDDFDPSFETRGFGSIAGNFGLMHMVRICFFLFWLADMVAVEFLTWGQLGNLDIL